MSKREIVLTAQHETNLTYILKYFKDRQNKEELIVQLLQIQINVIIKDIKNEQKNSKKRSL